MDREMCKSFGQTPFFCGPGRGRTRHHHGECVPIELRISRQELAELSDTTQFTVSRTVSAWDRMLILKAGRGRLTVIDPARLAGLAGDARAH
ncbi:helix-turn-helix domain-containing protein [Tardiphaga sp. 839_C3_N1_4]|uniref:helix-turn-helix domain-containing protein n=1 Tax=Tardiphaga sp. 839_C3_N1_4 TaxID=3240761 RepID=UPI003F215E82